MTYQALIHRLGAWCTAHPMVVRFTDGELELADLDKDSPTPHVHAALLGVSYGENSRTYEVEVYVMELYREQDNEALAVREALNNTLLIFEDLMAEVRNGFQSFGRLEVFPLLPVRPTPFIEEHNRVLVGVQATMQLQTPWAADACDSPINETGIPSIACPAASITTNGDSPALSVASGASQDIDIHDTAGADVGTRSGATVTVGDTTVTVNSSAYGTTEAETTFNVEVVDGGDNPKGSLSGGKWVVPDEYFVAITADEAETTIEFTVFFKDGGTRTVTSQTLTNGTIDTGGVVVNAAAGVNTFVGVSLSDGDTVEITYTASGGDFLVELEF